MAQISSRSRIVRKAPARSNRDLSRAVVIGIGFAGLFVIASSLGTGLNIAPKREATVARAATPSDDDLTTGSIVFMPVTGNTCRQKLIDNRTWEVRDNGTLSCDEAAARRPGGTPATRIDIIRESFRRTSP